MADIRIEPDRLSEVITLLKHDNENISKILNNIYEAVTKLDDSVWKSPGKQKVVNELVPYLTEEKDVETIKLNNDVAVLEKALNDYVTTNNIILKKTENLVGSEVVEEL